MQVWELSKCKLRTNHFGHTGYISTVTVSPDGSLCASGGKDGITMLWDLNEGKHLYSLEAGDTINALVFSPNRYWLCAATDSAVKIFDLESKVSLFPRFCTAFRDALRCRSSINMLFVVGRASCNVCGPETLLQAFRADLSSFSCSRSLMSSSRSSRPLRVDVPPLPPRSRGRPMDRPSSLGMSHSALSSCSALTFRDALLSYSDNVTRVYSVVA